MISTLALTLALLLCATATAATLIVGPSPPALPLQQALADAADGDTIALLPGRYQGPPAVVSGKRLTIRGVDQRPVLAGEGRQSGRQALLVQRGGELTLENLEFRGARADDGNGAGVLHEGGRLLVRNCLFLDNETGISSSNDPEAELTVEDSEFGLAPQVEGGLHHLLTVGRIGRFSIRGSRFYSGFEGHLIKSRARENLIAYNLIYDGDAGEASYEVDLPAGGLAWLIGNIIGQGPRAQNAVMVAYGSEGSAWPRNGLYMSHNTLVGNPWPPTWFVRVFQGKLPADAEIKLVNNLTLGLGLLSPGTDGSFSGNHWAPRRRALASIYTLDFEPTVASGWQGIAAPAGEGGGRSLVPTAQFKLPRGTVPLKAPAAWTPGAVQPD